MGVRKPERNGLTAYEPFLSIALGTRRPRATRDMMTACAGMRRRISPAVTCAAFHAAQERIEAGFSPTANF